MTVTKTKLNLGASPVNYIAVEPMRDGKYPPHVYASAPSVSGAIAACLMKKEARESMKHRIDELKISVLCRCEECV